MDNINDLVGDAAKQLMAQADGIQNPRLKESAKRVALTVSAKTRDETITKARNAAFARIPIWAFFLPVTRRQQIVLGRIYSFQCTTNKDGSPAEYRMSLSTGASELGMTNRADGKPVMFGETLYGGDGRDWLIVGIAGAWSYDVYGLHVAHDGKKEKKPLRAEWLVHELTDAGEEV